MGLFRRRRRYYSRRRRRLPTIWDNLVWAVDPDTAREIVAIILLLLGFLFGLGLFRLAGAFGETMLRLSSNLFGTLSYVVPFVLIYLGIRLLILRSEVMRATSVIGIILLFLLVPAMFGTYGGSVGEGVTGVYRSVLGAIGGLVALVNSGVGGGLIAL